MLEYLRATCLLLRLWWYFRWKHEALTWLTCVWFCQSPSHWLSFWRLICFVLPWRTHAMYVKCLQSKDRMAIHGNYRGWFIVIILPSELSAFFHPFYGQVRRYMFLPFLPTNTKFSAQNHRSPNTGIRSLSPEWARDQVYFNVEEENHNVYHCSSRIMNTLWMGIWKTHLEHHTRTTT